jgi:hypothetical protein
MFGHLKGYAHCFGRFPNNLLDGQRMEILHVENFGKNTAFGMNP